MIVTVWVGPPSEITEVSPSSFEVDESVVVLEGGLELSVNVMVMPGGGEL